MGQPSTSPLLELLPLPSLFSHTSSVFALFFSLLPFICPALSIQPYCYLPRPMPPSSSIPPESSYMRCAPPTLSFLLLSLVAVHPIKRRSPHFCRTHHYLTLAA